MLFVIPVISVLLTLNVNAQFYKPSGISLGLNDTLPDSFYKTLHRSIDMSTGQEGTFSFNDHKDKLVILDFWATWCGPCIGSLQKLASYVGTLDSDVIVVPVTYQESDTKQWLKDNPLPFVGIVADTLLGQLFPHAGIPYMVWIRDGKVVGMPRTDLVDPDVINAVAEGEPLPTYLTRQFFDEESFILKQSNRQGVLFRSEIQQGDPAYFQQAPFYTVRNGHTYFYIGNVPVITGLFGLAYEPLISPRYRVLGKGELSGIHTEIPDPIYNEWTKAAPDYDAMRSVKENVQLEKEWFRKRNYSYSFYADDSIPVDQVFKFLRQDLNSYFESRYGIKARIDTMDKPVVLIRLLDKKESVKDKLISRSGNKIYDIAAENRIHIDGWYYGSLLSGIRHTGVMPGDMPLLDRTGIDSKELRINIVLPKVEVGDYSTLNRRLKRYGLCLEEAKMPAPILKIYSSSNNQ